MIHSLLQLFIYLLVADVILSYFPDVRRQKWAETLHKIADAPQKPIREMLPKDIPIDPSPMIVIILIQVLMYIVSRV
jgi:YggT family protein